MDQPNAGGAPGRAADHPLARAPYARLTTFRRSGEAVGTAVWLAPSLEHPERFAVITVDATGKTKRLAHTQRVEVCACDVRGRVADGAPTYRGTATVVRDPAGVTAVRRAVAAKYGFPARFAQLSAKVTGLVGIRQAPRAGILIAVEPTPIPD